MNEYVGLDMDFDSINQIVGSLTDSGFSFERYVHSFSQSDSSSVFGKMYDGFVNIFVAEITSFRFLFPKVILIIILTSVFTTLSKTFKSRQVSETGFYVSYMILFMMLAATFGELRELSFNAVNGLLSFMKALVPVFFMCVSYIAGGETTVMFYQAVLSLIGIVQFFIVGLFIPAVNIYFVFATVNPLLGEDYFSHMLDLIEKTVNWGLKALFMIVMGAGLIQSIIVPAAAGVRKGMIGKTIKIIPGIGGTAGTVLESVYGAGIIIKNAVGAAGMIAIILICSVPIIKLSLYHLLFRFCAAASQPICVDKRILSCITAISDSSKLFFLTVGMSSVLFIVTIALITAASGLSC